MCSFPGKHLMVIMTFWRHLQDMSWKRFQRVFCVTIFRFPRVLKTSWRCLEDVLEDEKVLRWRRVEDVLKTCLEDVLKTSWRQTKYLLGISASNHGLLTNLNHYLTNLYLTHLYFTNLRGIQKGINCNPTTSILVLFWNSVSKLIQNLHYRTSEAMKTKFQATYYINIANDRLYSHVYLICIWKIYLH